MTTVHWRQSTGVDGVRTPPERRGKGERKRVGGRGKERRKREGRGTLPDFTWIDATATAKQRQKPSSLALSPALTVTDPLRHRTISQTNIRHHLPIGDNRISSTVSIDGLATKSIAEN